MSPKSKKFKVFIRRFEDGKMKFGWEISYQLNYMAAKKMIEVKLPGWKADND